MIDSELKPVAITLNDDHITFTVHSVTADGTPVNTTFNCTDDVGVTVLRLAYESITQDKE